MRRLFGACDQRTPAFATVLSPRDHPYEAGGISMSQRVSSFDSEPRDRILLNSMSKREIAFDRNFTRKSGDECADSITVYM